MDLFQTISLLERSAPNAARLGCGSGRGEAVRLSAHIALGFAPSDVHAVYRDTPAAGRPGATREAERATESAGAAADTSASTTGAAPALAPASASAFASAPSNATAVRSAATRWHLSSPVMALAGGNGPLPLATTEALLQSSGRRDPAPLAFLDIFHHRWLSFLYRGRKQHRLSLQWESPHDGPLARALGALSGLGPRRGANGATGDSAWLRHAALQGPAPRSMAQLAGLATDRLGLPVLGTQFVGGWLPLAAADTPRLGRGATLGHRAVLGQRAWDSAAGITLRVGPVPAGRWDALLPGGADLALLRALARRHLQQDVAVHVELNGAEAIPSSAPTGLTSTASTASTPPSWGARVGQARLGWSSWLSHRRGWARAPVRLHACSGASTGAVATATAATAAATASQKAAAAATATASGSATATAPARAQPST